MYYTVPAHPLILPLGLTEHSRFKCDTEFWNFCSPTAPSGAVYSGVSYTGTCTATSATFTVKDDSGFHGQARAVIFVLPTTASSTTLSSSSTPPTQPSQTSQIPQSSASSSSGGEVTNSHGGLSTSAKIAIGVAIPAVVIIGALILAFLVFRKRRRRRQQTPEVSPVTDAKTSPGSWGSPGAKSELSGDGMAEVDDSGQAKLFPFFAAARKSELDPDAGSRSRRSELPGTTPSYELPAEEPHSIDR